MQIPVISDWLRMEVALNAKNFHSPLSGISVEVDVEGAGIFRFLKGNRREDDFSLHLGRPFKEGAKEKMGELMRNETLSDIRYRIRRYFFQAQDHELIGNLET